MEKIELLTREKEIELGEIIKESPDPLQVEKAINAFVEANLPLVIEIAKDYHSTELSFNDLVQEGNIGLIDAAKTFDYTKGYKFGTYATPAIKHKIIDALRRTKKIQSKSSSFDTPLDKEGEQSLHDVIGDESSISPLDKMIEQEEEGEKRKRVKNISSRLKPKESLVLQKMSEGVTYKKIGKHPNLKLTSEGVRQIAKKLVRKSRYISIEETVKKSQALGIDYYKEIEPILISIGIICDEELTVGERLGDEGIRETIRKIEEEKQLVKSREDLTEPEREAVENSYEGIKALIQVPWERMKTLRMRGNRIVYPDKTKPKREDVFQAVTLLRALLEKKTGKPQWDLIEEILYPYCPQVFRGGNIESWYRKREREALKLLSPPPFLRPLPGSLINREERKKFILRCFRNTGRYGIAIPPHDSLCSSQQ